MLASLYMVNADACLPNSRSSYQERPLCCLIKSPCFLCTAVAMCQKQPTLSALPCAAPAPAAHPNILHNPQRSPQAGMQHQAPTEAPWPLSIRLETLPPHPLTPPCPPGLFTTGRARAALQPGQHRQPARARGRLHTRLRLLRRLHEAASCHTRTNVKHITFTALMHAVPLRVSAASIVCEAVKQHRAAWRMVAADTEAAPASCPAAARRRPAQR